MKLMMMQKQQLKLPKRVKRTMSVRKGTKLSNWVRTYTLKTDTLDVLHEWSRNGYDDKVAVVKLSINKYVVIDEKENMLTAPNFQYQAYISAYAHMRAHPAKVTGAYPRKKRTSVRHSPHYRLHDLICGEVVLKCPCCGEELQPPIHGLFACENDTCELIDCRYNVRKDTFYALRIDTMLRCKNNTPLVTA